MYRTCITCGRPAVAGRSRCKDHGGQAWARQSAARLAAYRDPVYQRNRKILLRDHPPCSLRYPGCTGIADTIDHIVAPRLGGSNEMGNLRPACRKCNERRGGAEGRATMKRRARRRQRDA
jgi:5-methylcytosine-specific restriction protein A